MAFRHTDQRNGRGALSTVVRRIINPFAVGGGGGKLPYSSLFVEQRAVFHSGAPRRFHLKRIFAEHRGTGIHAGDAVGQGLGDIAPDPGPGRGAAHAVLVIQGGA